MPVILSPKKPALSGECCTGKTRRGRKRERERERKAAFFRNLLNLGYTRSEQTGIAAFFITCLPCRNSTNAISLKEVSGGSMPKHFASHRVTLETGGGSFTAVSRCKGQATQSMPDLHNQTCPAACAI